MSSEPGHAFMVSPVQAALIESGVLTVLAMDEPFPDDLLGQRVFVVASDEEPTNVPGWFVEHVPGTCWLLRRAGGKRHMDVLRPGHVVCSVTVEASPPIMSDLGWDDEGGVSYPDPVLSLDYADEGIVYHHNGDPFGCGGREYDGQLPFSDFSPGRFGWVLRDPQPLTKACELCDGDGPVCSGVVPLDPVPYKPTRPCEVCDGDGWYWTAGSQGRPKDCSTCSADGRVPDHPRGVFTLPDGIVQ